MREVCYPREFSKPPLLHGLYLLLVLLIVVNLLPKANASLLNENEMANKQAAKNANVAEGQKLNETDATAQNSNSIPLEDTKRLVNTVNQVPGVKVSEKDLEPPEQPPIKGFHPIKRLLRPVENLEGMSIKLEQQIMKLEGPIAALQPPMLKLEDKVSDTNQQIAKMQSSLGDTRNEVQLVRKDLAGMKSEIEQMRQPIEELRAPIIDIANPLKSVQNQLNLILLAILFTALGVAIGTPIAAIQIYRYRHKIFSDLKPHEELLK